MWQYSKYGKKKEKRKKESEAPFHTGVTISGEFLDFFFFLGEFFFLKKESL